MMILACAVIIVITFLTLMVFGEDAAPDPKGPDWAYIMHERKWVQFIMDSIADRAVRGDRAVLDEVGACFQGVDAKGNAAWVFMVRFHRRRLDPEVAMITLIPAPKTKIDVITLTQPNL